MDGIAKAVIIGILSVLITVIEEDADKQFNICRKRHFV